MTNAISVDVAITRDIAVKGGMDVWRKWINRFKLWRCYNNEDIKRKKEDQVRIMRKGAIRLGLYSGSH